MLTPLYYSGDGFRIRKELNDPDGPRISIFSGTSVALVSMVIGVGGGQFKQTTQATAKTRAYSELRRAVQTGPANRTYAMRDEEWAEFRNDPEFLEAIG
jgi:hypothetical protein